MVDWPLIRNQAVVPLFVGLQPGATIMADDDENIRRIPIKNLRQEEGAQEPASSLDMEPYLACDFLGKVTGY